MMRHVPHNIHYGKPGYSKSQILVELAKKKHGRGMIRFVFSAATEPLEYLTALAVSWLRRTQNVEFLASKVV